MTYRIAASACLAVLLGLIGAAAQSLPADATRVLWSPATSGEIVGTPVSVAGLTAADIATKHAALAGDARFPREGR